MAKQVNTRLERRQIDGIEAMESDGLADNQSEAHRLALDVGLSELGYATGATRQTWLVWFVNELSKVLVFLTVGWMGATLFFPVEFRAVTMYLLAATLGVVGVGQALTRFEPRVSEWMTSRMGQTKGEKA